MTTNQRYSVANWEKILAYIAAFITLFLVVFLVIRNQPFASQQLAVMVRILLSLCVAIIGATVPGFLNVSLKGKGIVIRAGGALALFVLTYFFTPQALPLSAQVSINHIENRLENIETWMSRVNAGGTPLVDDIALQTASQEQEDHELMSLKENLNKLLKFTMTESEKGNQQASQALADFSNDFDIGTLQKYIQGNLPQDSELKRELSEALVSIASLSNPLVGEASGLATSQITNDLLWTVNDSGDEAKIYAVSFSGFDRGSFLIDNAQIHDWEDLASYRFRDKRYLLIADTGDNRTRRDSYSIYRLEEPSFGSSTLSGADSHISAERIDFVYSDGHHDGEAVAVDPSTHTLFIISKGRGGIPKVFKLELPQVVPDGLLVAEFVTDLNLPSWKTGDDANSVLMKRANWKNMVTSLDISRDGLKAVVLTYSGIYEYTRESGISWMETFTEEPKLIHVVKSRQAEGISYSLTGQSLHIINEGSKFQLVNIDSSNRETKS